MRQATWRFFGNVKEGRIDVAIVAVLQAKTVEPSHRTAWGGELYLALSLEGLRPSVTLVLDMHPCYVRRSETPCSEQDLAVMWCATLCTVNQ